MHLKLLLLASSTISYDQHAQLMPDSYIISKRRTIIAINLRGMTLEGKIQSLSNLVRDLGFKHRFKNLKYIAI